ncbi:MAG: hypothetical protein LBR89_02040 [Holosporales bacterium]|jgi:hypothetical protein|nr:hypothetical protein [Holosporales bacterium]
MTKHVLVSAMIFSQFLSTDGDAARQCRHRKDDKVFFNLGHPSDLEPLPEQTPPNRKASRKSGHKRNDKVFFNLGHPSDLYQFDEPLPIKQAFAIPHSLNFLPESEHSEILAARAAQSSVNLFESGAYTRAATILAPWLATLLVQGQDDSSVFKDKSMLSHNFSYWARRTIRPGTYSPHPNAPHYVARIVDIPAFLLKISPAFVHYTFYLSNLNSQHYRVIAYAKYPEKIRLIKYVNGESVDVTTSDDFCVAFTKSQIWDISFLDIRQEWGFPDAHQESNDSNPTSGSASNPTSGRASSPASGSTSNPTSGSAVFPGQ